MQKDEEMTKLLAEELKEITDQIEQPMQAKKAGNKKFSEGFMALIERKQKQM
jgi:hypothetical protein